MGLSFPNLVDNDALHHMLLTEAIIVGNLLIASATFTTGGAVCHNSWKYMYMYGGNMTLLPQDEAIFKRNTIQI